MRRSPVSLSDIADLRTLNHAFWLASRGKHERPEVRRFAENLDNELNQLSRDIREESLMTGLFNRFKIYDPKPREICAPCFRDRVLHHALMIHAGPVLERGAIFDSYACRKGKGTLRAVLRAQKHLRRYSWYVQIDIRHFFDSINHRILKKLLRRRFKNKRLLVLCDKIIDSYSCKPECGLPIGALTSQYFANAYLDGLDRFLLENCGVAGMVRYMDDVVWWGRDKVSARRHLSSVCDYLDRQRALQVKESKHLQRSRCGLRLCGFRILPQQLRLTLRRKRRYKKAWQGWERGYQLGLINEMQLQRCYDTARSVIAHANTNAWQRKLHNKMTLSSW